MHWDFEACYRAMSSRDARFDGRFVVAVTSTGIYCRPVCPAQTPKRTNVRFYANPTAAEAGGFRACRRCRPQSGLVATASSAGAVTDRALHLIGNGAADAPGGVGVVATRLGISARHLTRVVQDSIGLTPLHLARMRRLHTARTLIAGTAMPITDVAFAAGFASLRQFNEVVRTELGRTPSQLRSAGELAGQADGELVLRLPFHPPLDSAGLLSFFALRAVPGVEAVDQRSYRRVLRLSRGTAFVQLVPGDDHVRACLRLEDIGDLAAAVDCCRRLLDLEADPTPINAVLAADELLAPLVSRRPGTRVPGAASAEEMAVRAVLGQQVSVPRATVLATRLVTLCGDGVSDSPGGLQRIFPSSSAIADADLSQLGLTHQRAATLRRLCLAVTSGELQLDGNADRDQVRRGLLRIQGIGEWTAAYVAMRALGDPDAYLHHDSGVRRGFGALGVADGTAQLEHAERWHPWRSYGVVHLWRATPGPTSSTEGHP